MHISKLNKKIIALFITLVLFIFVFIQNDERKINKPIVQSAYDFTLSDKKGVSHQLGSIDKNYKILHFWATWCEPCIDEIPKLFDFAKSNQDQSLKVVLVSLDDNWKNAMTILSKFKLPQNVISLLDSESKVADAYGSYQFPESFLIDNKLMILKKWVGPQEWNDNFLDDLLN